ncbi:hypothetical protein F9282_17800 [Proteus terrae subsp. cibarius]|uniref:Morphogenetic protein n=1 Tax=Proteus terrae subsp. cibarius TaxID=626774 RepID=A0ABX6JW24_9GAMM|nr:MULTISPECIES: hypothetical protein [Proteus]MBI6406306.1 hypothetical protein [Proteus sp. PR00208]NDO97860.1 hypothetical protein [Proteus sp. G4441]QGW04722.1 hypothetical protein F9282_17800 [Proteus terrae subsp. cibarius]QIF91871.1 hypothetical protein GTH23_18445 [Proteus terrae subsp. cibarius]
MSKERGIIFNTEMVKAILDGRKTQTRRVMNNQPCTLSGETISVQQDDFNFRWAGDLHNDTSGWFPCPLGKVGDRLWVRETFKTGVCTESTIAYKATHKPSDLEEGWYEEIKWTPSIHMPRRYSRITLEITDVRVERLKSADDNEFKAEGYPLDRELTGGSMDPFCWFRNLWDSVSPTNFKYADNPWVWVIEFKRI